jgi:hypothetical protein
MLIKAGTPCPLFSHLRFHIVVLNNGLQLAIEHIGELRLYWELFFDKKWLSFCKWDWNTVWTRKKAIQSIILVESVFWLAIFNLQSLTTTKDFFFPLSSFFLQHVQYRTWCWDEMTNCWPVFGAASLLSYTVTQFRRYWSEYDAKCLFKPSTKFSNKSPWRKLTLLGLKQGSMGWWLLCTEPMALCMLGKHSTTEQHLQPF